MAASVTVITVITVITTVAKRSIGISIDGWGSGISHRSILSTYGCSRIGVGHDGRI